MGRPRKKLDARTADAINPDSVVALLLADDPTSDDNPELRRLLRANAKLAEPVADVGGYVRISEYRPDRDADGSIGVLRQARRILRHATDRQVRVIRWYMDNDFSAANPNVKRPSYLALLEDIRTRRVGGLVAWDLVRLYRQYREFQDLVDVHKSRPSAEKPYIATCDGQVDLSTPQGTFMAGMLVLVGAMESAMTSKRIRDKKAARFDEGWWQGGTVPYGYRRNGDAGRLDLEPSEAAVVAEMAKLVLEGWNLSRVCRHLNSAGYQPRRGDWWRTQTVRGMLLNPLYGGYRTYQPMKPLSMEPDGDPMVVATDKWPAILGDDDMLRLRAILTAEGRRTTGPAGGSVRKYLGSGLLTCGPCGQRKVYGRPRGKSGGRPQAPAYSCTACRGAARPAHLVDAFLRGFLVDAAESEPALLADALTENPESGNSGKAEVLARLSVVQAELGKDPAAVITESGLTFATYASLRRGLEAEEQALLASLVPAGRSRAVLPPGNEVEALVADPDKLTVVHDLLADYLDTYGVQIVLNRVGRGTHNQRGRYSIAERPDLYGIEVRRAAITESGSSAA